MVCGLSWVAANQPGHRYSKLLDGLLWPEEMESEPQLIRQEELIFNKQRKIELRPQTALLSALSIFRRSECPKVRQLPRVLEDGSGILMQDTVHVAVLLGKQPFQEANVATPSRDEQCNVGRLLSSLQREGWEGVKEEVRKLPAVRTHICGLLALGSGPQC